MRTGAEIVELLEDYLRKKKITRKQFCALVDIPPSTVATWKSKNAMPSIDSLSSVAKFMNISLDDLLFESYEYFEEKIATEEKLEKINEAIISICSDLDSINEEISKIKKISSETFRSRRIKNGR